MWNLKKVGLVEAESRMMITRGWGGGKGVGWNLEDMGQKI